MRKLVWEFSYIYVPSLGKYFPDGIRSLCYLRTLFLVNIINKVLGIYRSSL